MSKYRITTNGEGFFVERQRRFLFWKYWTGISMTRQGIDGCPVTEGIWFWDIENARAFIARRTKEFEWRVVE